MSITKNPFERPFQGKSETVKPDTTKADVTLTPSKRALVPEAKTEEAKKPSAHVGAGLPPTRKGSAKAEETPAPAPAGFQKANPFNTPRHPRVSNTGPPAEAQASWQTGKRPPAPTGPASASGVPAVPGSSTVSDSDNAQLPAVVGGAVTSSTSASPTAVTTTSQGFEIMQGGSSTADDYSKKYAQRLDHAEMTVQEIAAQTVTSENYREVFQAQQQLEAEKKLAQQNQQMGDFIIERRKQLEEASANAHKARGLLTEMAQLQLQLVPDMDMGERNRIYGKLEELRVALAQVPFYG